MMSETLTLPASKVSPIGKDRTEIDGKPRATDDQRHQTRTHNGEVAPVIGAETPQQRQDRGHLRILRTGSPPSGRWCSAEQERTAGCR